MAARKAFGAQLALLQATPTLMVASALLVFISAWSFYAQVRSGFLGQVTLSRGGVISAEELEGGPPPPPFAPSPHLEALYAQAMPWVPHVLLLALLVNVVSESAMRRQLEYAAAYIGASAGVFLSVACSVPAFTAPQLIAAGLGVSLVLWGFLGMGAAGALALGLYVSAVSASLALLLSSILACLRAPHRYWLAVTALLLLKWFVIGAKPSASWVFVPYVAAARYATFGNALVLAAPVALNLLASALLSLLWSWRR